MVSAGLKPMGKDLPSTKPLAYRLRKPVRHHLRDASPVLVLNFPLKYIILHPFWRSTIERLNTGTFIASESILSCIPRAAPRKVEAFLEDLVQKGFLEKEGSLLLSNYPHVSIIIPVRNRPEEIATCLQSIDRLDYPAEKKEVIVVDDGSDDHTPRVIAAFPVQLISLKERKQVSYCRNLAAQKAKGEILAFLDSDCVADPLWLKEIIPAFGNQSNGAVGGMVAGYADGKGLDRYESVMSSSHMGSWPKTSRSDDRFFYLPTCNLLVRRMVFLALGGFKEDMVVGEDVDFCWRLQDQGHHIEYRPIGKVYHAYRNTIRPFFIRRFEYGTSEPQLQKRHLNRIKHIVLRLSDVLFWGSILLSAVSGYLPVLGGCGMVLMTDAMVKSTRIRRENIPVSFLRLLLSTFRSYLSFFYHQCAFVSRYYLWGAPVFFLWAPSVTAIILSIHLLASVVSYAIKKPPLHFPLFCFYFTVDQLAYQLGVWWGCLKGLFFRPVNPRLVGKSFSKERR